MATGKNVLTYVAPVTYNEFMSTQQGLLFPIPVPARCVYCHGTKAKTQLEREMIDERFYPDEPGYSGAPCCTPESTYTCPQCGSDNLDFAVRYASYDDDETAEMYHCYVCKSTGPAEDAAPAKQPWAELEAVAKACAQQRGFEHWNDYLEAVRNAQAREQRSPC